MATIVARRETLREVVGSIAGQLDVLYLYMNDYEAVPEFLFEFSNVRVLVGAEGEGDLNANGKMVFLDYETEGVAFTLDDDIVYPEDYVDRLLGELAKYDYKAGCAVHGSFIHDSAVWYYERSFVAAMKQRRDASEIVNLVGSGTAAFPVSAMRGFDREGPVWVDLQMSLLLLRSGFPLVVIPRSKGWIRPLKYEGLYQKYVYNISHHTLRLHEAGEWRESNLRALWRAVLERLVPESETRAVERLGLGETSRAFINGVNNSHAGFGRIAFSKVVDFASVWGDG